MQQNDRSPAPLPPETKRTLTPEPVSEQGRIEDSPRFRSADAIERRLASMEAELAYLRKVARARVPRNGFGGTIQRLRESKNYSMAQLARLSGCSKPSLSRIERQERPNIKLHNILRLAAGLGLRPSEVFSAYERDNLPNDGK
jgi:DNA-binding XRE family transcriptional regulator